MSEQTNPTYFHLSNFGLNQWIQPLMVALLTTAYILGPVTVLRLWSPSPAWAYLTTVLLFVAFEAAFTTIWLRHPDRIYLAKLQYRVAEFILIAGIIRLFTWQVTGDLPTIAAWRTYLLEPFTLFEGGFFTYLLLAFWVWFRTIHGATLFAKMAMSELEAKYFADLHHLNSQINASPFNENRERLAEEFIRSWLFGGILLVVCASISTFRGEELAERFTDLTRLGLQPEMLTALLVYFLGGLWLVAQSKLAVNYAQWNAARVRTDGALMRGWHVASLGVLAVIAGISTLLPIGSTVGLSRILNAGISLIVTIFQAIYLFIISILARLFAGAGQEETAAQLQEQLQVQPAIPPITPPTTIAPASDTPELVIGGLFWILVIVVCCAAVLFFLRERGITIKWQIGKAFWIGFVNWLRGAIAGISRQAKGLQTEFRERLGQKIKMPATPTPKWQFVRVNGLSPREQIRYFYLSVVRRAEEKGVTRQESETPLEYIADLKNAVPEAEKEIEALTEAFLFARYSRQDFDKEESNSIKKTWKTIRTRLKNSA